jgi:hypothetical protein
VSWMDGFNVKSSAAGNALACSCPRHQSGVAYDQIAGKKIARTSRADPVFLALLSPLRRGLRKVSPGRELPGGRMAHAEPAGASRACMGLQLDLHLLRFHVERCDDFPCNFQGR